MPSRAKKVVRDVAKLPSIPKEQVALFLTGPMTGEAINEAGLVFKKALVEASLNAELSHHVGYEAGAERPELVTNQRNGSTAKSVLTGDGKIRIETPRDRDGSFEPLLVPKHARRFTGFDDKVTAPYARGLTVREIQAYLLETYDTEVSSDFISAVTDGVLAEVTAWQSRPLELVYAVVFGACPRARPEGRVASKDQGRRCCVQQGDLSGARRAPGRHARDSGSVDRDHGGRQILDEGVQRPQNPRCGRHVDRGHRWPEGHAGGAERGVPGHHAADLHCASDPQQP
jgi:hypothetical protein